MELTREADYAVLCVLDVAKAGHTSAAEVARRNDVSATFLGKIVGALARSGIVTARRGIGGGITLARPLDSITLLEVIEAIQGPLRINACLHCPSRCERTDGCAVYRVWQDAQAGLEQTLSVSFQEILNGDGTRLALAAADPPEDSDDADDPPYEPAVAVVVADPSPDGHGPELADLPKLPRAKQERPFKNRRSAARRGGA